MSWLLRFRLMLSAFFIQRRPSL